MALHCLIAQECRHYAFLLGGNLPPEDDEGVVVLQDPDFSTCVLELISKHHSMHPGPDVSDGNCLLEALALPVLGESYHHHTMRTLLCDYAVANPRRVAKFIEAEGLSCSVEAFIAPYRHNGYWGQFFLILLFEEMFDCLVHIFSPDFFTQVPGSPPSFLMPHDPLEVQLLRHRPALHVFFNGTSHYVPLSKEDDLMFTVGDTSLLSAHRARASCKHPSEHPAWEPVLLADLTPRLHDSVPVPPSQSAPVSTVPATFQTDAARAPSQPSLYSPELKFPTYFVPAAKPVPVEQKPFTPTPSTSRPLFSRATHLSPLFGIQVPASEDLSRYRPCTIAMWPPAPNDSAGFIAPPQVFDQPGNRAIALVRRSPQVKDHIVLPLDHTGSNAPHPSDWRTFAQYASAAYVVAAVSGDTVYAELPTLLVAPPDQSVTDLPPYVMLTGLARWYIGIPLGLSGAPAPTDRESNGIALFADSFGREHQYVRNKAVSHLTECEVIMVAAGPGRFYIITYHCGNNILLYVSEKLLEGVEREWLRQYNRTNPSILFPIIPYRSQCWYVAHLARTSGSPVDPGMLILCWTFFHPWTGQINQGIRFCHFLPVGHPGVAANGDIRSLDAFHEAWRAAATAYGILYGPAYGTALRDALEHALSRQIGTYLDLVYYEAKIIDCLASFSDHFRNPDVTFHPLGTPPDTMVRGRDLSPDTWASYVGIALIFTEDGISPEEERQFLRQKDLCFPAGWPGNPFGLPKPRRETAPPQQTVPTLPAAPARGRKQDTSSAPTPTQPTATKHQMICFPDFLHTMKISGADGKICAPCTTPNCVRLHYTGITHQLSYLRGERAALGAPETRDPTIRAAFLAKMRTDPKFTDRSQSGPARP